MLKDVNKSKYSSLETDLKPRLAGSNYQRLSRLVIATDAMAHLDRIPKHMALSGALGLEAKSANELSELYAGIIYPLNEMLFEIRTECIGTRNQFGRGPINTAPAKKTSDERKALLVNNFTEGFFGLLAREGLDDKRAIKSVILYPLVVSVISSWGKHDPGFAKMFVYAISSREQDAELKAAIWAIDKPVSPRG